jgi:hypothetical protein
MCHSIFFRGKGNLMEFGTYIKLDEIEPAQIWGINDDFFFICHGCSQFQE